MPQLVKVTSSQISTTVVKEGPKIWTAAVSLVMAGIAAVVVGNTITTSVLNEETEQTVAPTEETEQTVAQQTVAPTEETEQTVAQQTVAQSEETEQTVAQQTVAQTEQTEQTIAPADETAPTSEQPPLIPSYNQQIKKITSIQNNPPKPSGWWPFSSCRCGD